MLTQKEIETKVKEIKKEEEYLTVDEFAKKADVFFEDINITSEIIEKLINRGYIPFHEEKEIVPTNKLLEFNPHSLLNIEEFANRAGLTEEKVQELIEKGIIEVLTFLNENQIHIKEFRDYAKETGVEAIYDKEGLYEMLDDYFRSSSWWDDFFSDRERPVPFFINAPDENLVSYFKEGIIKPKKVLELGCGNGRNAVFLANQGCEVDAVDMSQEAISWGVEMAEKESVNINFICKSIFDLDIEEEAYDLVYDSGCFHHIPPHRRFSYLNLVKQALKPEKHFGLTCFNSKMGSDFTDWEVYQKRSLGGGLSYSKKEIENIFTDIFKLIKFREMKDVEEEELFGEPFMWTMLFKKRNL